MNKVEYFKYGLKNHYYRYKSWILGCFSIVTDDIKIPKKQTASISLEDEVEGQPLMKTNGTFKVALVNGEYVKIDEATVNEPIYSFHDNIVLKPGDLPNVKEEITTTYGRALTNAILLTSNFNDKLDYINGEVKIGDIEDQISKRLTDNIPKEQRDLKNKEKIYVDEYISFCDACMYLTGLTQITVLCATEKLISPAPGIDEFKAKLLKKYEGKLTDPIQFISFEKELKEYDDAYLKTDPTWGIFMAGGKAVTSRKKLFLCLGAEGGDSTGVRPVINSLSEGWPKDNVLFTDLINNMRFGFYARGKETVKGGVIAKTVMRTTNNFVVLDEDCGTEEGIRVKLTSFNLKGKVGRYVRLNNKWSRVDSIDMLKPYLGKEMMFRSPMFCRCKGDRICKFCSGDNLAVNPRSMATALTDLSSVILGGSMKAMHGSTLSMAKLVLSDLIT